MGEWSAVEDLFLLGLGIDIVAAWVLASGLIMSDEEIVGVSRPYWGPNPELLYVRTLDRLKALVGVALFTIGFVVQGIGYVIDLSSTASDQSSPKQAIAGGLSLAVGLLLAIAAYFVAKRVLLKRRVYNVCRISAEGKEMRLLEVPTYDFLAAVGSHGWRRNSDESAPGYCHRVFSRFLPGPASRKPLPDSGES